MGLREVVEIPLRRSKKKALVSPRDADLVRRHKWYHYSHKGREYALANINGPGTSMTMHRIILGRESADDGMEVDHIDGDGLNNTRGNLRVVTHRQNVQNGRVRRGDWKGVDKVGELYRAQIHCDRKMFLGYFDDPEMAAAAYDDKAKELFGEYAWLNFPDGHSLDHESARRRRPEREYPRGAHPQTLADGSIRFQCRVTTGGRSYHLGVFDCPLEAASLAETAIACGVD